MQVCELVGQVYQNAPYIKLPQSPLLFLKHFEFHTIKNWYINDLLIQITYDLDHLSRKTILVSPKSWKLILINFPVYGDQTALLSQSRKLSTGFKLFMTCRMPFFLLEYIHFETRVTVN